MSVRNFNSLPECESYVILMPPGVQASENSGRFFSVFFMTLERESTDDYPQGS